MPTSSLNTQSCLFDSLPEPIQSALTAYAKEAELSLDAVITFAIAYFLELESISLGNKESSTKSINSLDDLPAPLQSEIKNYAAEEEMPLEFVVELAIAHFLDSDSVTFDDCITGLQRERVELLRQQKRNLEATAA